MGRPEYIFLSYPEARHPDHARLMLHRVNKRCTVSGAVKRYLKDMRSRKMARDYVTNTRFALKAFTKVYGERPVAFLSEREVRRVMRRVYKRVQPHTYATYSRIWRLFFEFCRRENLTLYNYVREFEYPYHRAVAFFNSYQMDKLFLKLLPGTELRDAVDLLYHSGMSRSDLNDIVGVSYLTGEIILRYRRVRAPALTLLTAERRKLYNVKRLVRNFAALMKEFDFPGNLRFVTNAYLLRAYWAGTPLEVIQWQMGERSVEDVERRLKRLLSAAQGFYRFAREYPYHDYW